ncbi:MAG TPA: chemotaxis protein CheD [Gemmatimonadales bacterium]|nr:chemotaxis protein CheD [Gemmatimonadales bacterium]
MTRREVQFGLGDLGTKLAALVAEDTGSDAEAPPARGPGAMVYVHVGQLFVAPESRVVSTILGSCVAVCVWDVASGVGGLNHFLLPQCVENGISSPRFGNVAIHQLLDGIKRLGSQVSRLQAKIFGGASVIDAFAASRSSLGMQNVDLARRTLGQLGIPIVAEDVGGSQGRKLVFRTDDGSAWVRKI